MQQKLKMGMVGGGSDAFIGAIHRNAAFMDNLIELVCGCFPVLILRYSEIQENHIFFLPMNASTILIMRCSKKKCSYPKTSVWISLLS